MTFCLGMKSRFGLVAIADTRITNGSEVSFAKKISTHRGESHGMFVMTSGLRSIRDKALTYFDERLASDEAALPRLHLVANALAQEIRRVRTEDEAWLAKGRLSFDLHAILGGQMADDQTCRMFLICRCVRRRRASTNRGPDARSLSFTRLGRCACPRTRANSGHSSPVLMTRSV